MNKIYGPLIGLTPPSPDGKSLQSLKIFHFLKCTVESPFLVRHRFAQEYIDFQSTRKNLSASSW